MTNSRAINPHHFTLLTGGILVSWFLLALACSWFGVFNNPQRPPLLIGAAAVLPVLLFAGWYLRSSELRQFLLAADLRLLTLVQTARVAGIVFVTLYLGGYLPGMFALPAGLGDMAIGATAPLAAWAVARGKSLKGFFLWWTALGMLDLVLAVTLGVLASGTFLGSRPGAITTAMMERLPLSLIPTFLVPLYLILHLIGLSRLQSTTTQHA